LPKLRQIRSRGLRVDCPELNIPCEALTLGGTCSGKKSPAPGKRTIVFNSEDGASYSVRISQDLIDWTTEVVDATGTGTSTSVTIPAAQLPAGVRVLFFRVQSN
jgi:hypothetical protein